MKINSYWMDTDVSGSANAIEVRKMVSSQEVSINDIFNRIPFTDAPAYGQIISWLRENKMDSRWQGDGYLEELRKPLLSKAREILVKTSFPNGWKNQQAPFLDACWILENLGEQYEDFELLELVQDRVIGEDVSEAVWLAKFQLLKFIVIPQPGIGQILESLITLFGGRHSDICIITAMGTLASEEAVEAAFSIFETGEVPLYAQVSSIRSVFWSGSQTVREGMKKKFEYLVNAWKSHPQFSENLDSLAAMIQDVTDSVAQMEKIADVMRSLSSLSTSQEDFLADLLDDVQCWEESYELFLALLNSADVSVSLKARLIDLAFSEPDSVATWVIGKWLLSQNSHGEVDISLFTAADNAFSEWRSYLKDSEHKPLIHWLT